MCVLDALEVRPWAPVAPFDLTLRRLSTVPYQKSIIPPRQSPKLGDEGNRLMKTFEIRSTSRSSAGCNPIVLREGDQVRLVFLPTLVENPGNPKASVDGQFVYQRK